MNLLLPLLRRRRGGYDAYAILGYRPALVLDFDDEYYRANSSTTTFAGALTFARASAATYVDSTGTLQTASSGVARVGHHIWNGTSWVNEGLLHESEARTNLVTYSNSFGGAGWTRDNFGTASAPVVSATNILSPDGTNNASEIVFDTGAGATAGDASRLIQGPLLSLSAVPHTGSVWLKVPSGSAVVELLVSGAADSVRDIVVTDKWTRFDTTGTPSSIFAFSVIVRGDTTPGSTTLHIYGAQLEQASTPSSYIPTSGATVTRAAETLTVPAAKLPYSATAMSIQMQGRATGGSLVPARWYLDANNYLTQEINTSDFTFEQAASGTVDAVTGGSFTSGVNTSFNIASRHGSTFINGAVDGTALTANTTPTALPDLSATDLSLGNVYMGTIKNVRIWAADITDAGLEAATV